MQDDKSPKPGDTVVVTDSACGLTTAQARDIGVLLVPYILVADGQSLRDGIDLTPSEFFAQLPTYEALPTTSAPPPGAFRDLVEPLWEAGANVLVVCAASTVTSSYQSAELATQEPTGTIAVVDSRQASGGEALVVSAAARAAVGGKDLPSCVAAAEQVASQTRLVATIDTFVYLKRSGRVPGIAAMLAGALDLKPVFTLRDGEISQVARPRGRQKSLRRVVDELESDATGRTGALHVAALHADCEDDGRRLLADVAHHDPVESILTEFTPVMGTHTGPGVCGLAWWWEEDGSVGDSAKGDGP